MLAVAGFLATGIAALAQDQAGPTAGTNGAAPAYANESTSDSFLNKLWDRRLGPFNLHPRLMTSFTYDNNILLSTSDKEADGIWMVQPGLQAVAGDDAALIAFRQEYNDVLSLTPGNMIVVPAEWRAGKLLMLDYAPRFQEFDRYTSNDSLDQFATFDFLYPMNKFVFGAKQDYSDQKMTIVEAGQRTVVESMTTTLSGAYEFGEKTSVEADFHRLSVDYAATDLVGYTEYNTEDWFNYNLAEDMPVSLGVLAGEDIVADHQDETYEQLRLRGRYLRTQKLTLDLSAGGELRQYQNGNPMVFNPVFSLLGEYRPGPRTTVRLNAYRTLYASIFNGYNYTSTGATVDLSQGITSRYTATLSFGYFGQDATTVTRPIVTHTDSYSSVRFSFAAKIARHFTGSIFWQWLNRQSQFDGGLDDSQFGVQLNLNY